MSTAAGEPQAPRRYAGQTRGIQLGLRANWPQFTLLVAVNALVGGVLGQERAIMPLVAEREFGLAAHSSALTFILAFGLAKAATNVAAGVWSDRVGRKPVLVTGWLIALPVPVLIAVAPSWSLVVVANVLLGISQGLTWSTTVIMKIDLAGPRRRGVAMGLNEAAGYLAVAVTALTTAAIAQEHGLRPWPFLLGLSYAVLGLGLSVALVRETSGHAEHEGRGSRGTLPTAMARQVWLLTSWRDPSLSSASQAGLVNNLNDGLAWGLFPVLFASAGLGLREVGVLVAIYPAVWGLGQLATGAAADYVGRKPMVVGGMLLQGAALWLVATASGAAGWALAMALLGAGTAMVYPALLAVVGDVADPLWRARAFGIYRWWRDLGFAVGAVVCGVLADWLGLRGATMAVAALTAVSGVIAAVRLRETMPAKARQVR